MKFSTHDIDFWEKLYIEQYDSLFVAIAIRRLKFEKFTMNADVVAGNSGAD